MSSTKVSGVHGGGAPVWRFLVCAAFVLGAACGEQGAPTGGVAPPVVGDIAGTGAAPAPTVPAEGPRVDRARQAKAAAKPKEAPTGAVPPGDGPAGDAPPSGALNPKTRSAAGGQVALPPDFQPVHYCLMPKLGTCSIYGKGYNRLDAVTGFCGKLGGEITTYCPSEGVVSRCKTSVDVLTHYYSTGERKYTREEAEKKCTEKKWTVLPPVEGQP